MSDATVPGVTVARPGAARGRRRRQGPTAGQERTRRITVAVVLLVSAIALVAANHAVRGLEAKLFAPLAGLFVPTGGTGTTGSILYVALGQSSAFGLRITDECTTTVLIVPVLVVVAAFALMRSIPLRRVAMSLAVAIGCLLAVNAVRIAVVAFSTFHWGEEGFRVAHVLIGSAFALCGFALALVLAIRVLVRGGRAHPAG